MTAPANARPSGAIVIACLALTLSALAIGFLIGRNSAALNVAARPDDTSERRADDASLIAAIQDLKDTVQRQPQGVREPAQTSGDGHAVTAVSAEQMEKLTASVDKLNEIIDQRTRGLTKLGSSDSAWKGPGYPTLADLHDRVRYWRLSKDPKWRQKLEDELNEAHGFWTRDEVLERYGRPTELHSGGASLNMAYLRDEGTETSGFVEFQVADGYVHKIIGE